MRVLSIVALSASLLSGALLAQVPGFAPPAPAKPSAVTTGFMHAIHATNEVEKTLAFYRDVFGVDGQVRDFANQAVPILTNSPGVTLKVSMMTLPGQGFNFELTQFSNVERHPAQPQISDPGAPHMKFLVRDVDAVVANIKRAGAHDHHHVASAGAREHPAWQCESDLLPRPRRLHRRGGARCRAEADAPAGNVLGSIMGLTVRDMEETTRFWSGYARGGN